MGNNIVSKVPLIHSLDGWDRPFYEELHPFVGHAQVAFTSPSQVLRFVSTPGYVKQFLMTGTGCRRKSTVFCRMSGTFPSWGSYPTGLGSRSNTFP